MYKIAAIIGGVLLMAGVALAGTVSSLGAANSPTIGQTIPTASVTVRQEDRAAERRGREAEARGRANEAGEDVRQEDRGVAVEPGDDRGRHSGASPTGATAAATTVAASPVTAATAATTDSPRKTRWPAAPLPGRLVVVTIGPMNRPKRTILLVEDETSIREPLAEVLRSEGFETLVAGSVAEALEQARRDPDLVLLDVMLPDGSGFDVCRELRRDSQVPIIMLTARGEETDRVIGLELGADDYVVKPFSGREVVARIRAVLRRTAAPEPDDGRPLEVADVRLDPAKREVTLRGDVLELSRKEFELLQLLMRNAGSVVTRERLIDEVWDPNWFGSTKTLDVHVSGIRRKLGDDPGKPRYVHTVRGVGFRFSSPDEVE